MKNAMREGLRCSIEGEVAAGVGIRNLTINCKPLEVGEGAAGLVEMAFANDVEVAGIGVQPIDGKVGAEIKAVGARGDV